MKLSKRQLIKIIEGSLGPDSIEKPGSGSETPRDVYDRTGRDIGYSPIQDIDKLIEPILVTGVSILNPAVAGYYVGTKTIGNITLDIAKMYKNDQTKDKKKFKKELQAYIGDHAIDKAVNKVPVVGNFLKKIPGYKSLKTRGKKVVDAVFDEIEAAVKKETSDSIKSKN